MQKHIKTICVVCFVLLMCMSFVLEACDTTPEVEITKITLDKDTLSMKVGDEATLTATVEPAEAAKDIVWTVNKEGIVTVDGGKVKAVAAGTAIVSAQNKSGTVYASCTIVVEEVVNSVKLNKNTLELTVGETETLTVTVDPTTAADKLVWKCDSVGIVKVDGGKVTALSAGTATITVSDPTGAKSDSYTVTVYATATEITLDKTAVDMYVGDEQTIVATVVPQGTKAVTFDSSDKEVATVDTDGTITVVGAGTTTITVTIDGVTANVTVSAVKVAFAQANYSLALNAEQQLALTFEPATATETNIAYSSSDSAIVSVDGEGKVKAKAYGQATITASAEGKFSVTCTVTVSPLATENGVTVEYGENGYAIKTSAGIYVNALNLGDGAASKVYYAEYTLNGMNLFDGQAKSFGLVHFATNENLMVDVFHMFVIGNDPATAGYWHRMNNKMDLENDTLVNVANQDLGAVHTWLIDMLKNGKSVTVGIARNGNNVYTLINGVVVLQTNKLRTNSMWRCPTQDVRRIWYSRTTKSTISICTTPTSIARRLQAAI